MSSTHSRPDNRPESPELLGLRNATRELRLHLDTLPIDYKLDAAPHHFLAGLAFMHARQRYACADSMLGAGFGGSVIGSLAGASSSKACAGYGSAKIRADADRSSATSSKNGTGSASPSNRPTSAT